MMEPKTQEFALAGRQRCGLVMLTALGACLYATSALAAGVSAGTLIQNTAIATYTSGAASGSITSNTVSVTVDELLDVAVANLNSTPATAGAAPAVLVYTITNTGNGAEAFNLSVNPAVAGNPFDATVELIAIDSNGNGVYDAGIDQVLPAGTATPSLAADSSLTIFVLVKLPAGATDGQISQVKLTASAVTGIGAPGTEFAGQGAGGGDAVVGASGADDDADGAVLARLATVTLTKAAVIVDPFGGSQPVPGAVVTYSLTAAVSGSGQLEALQIADAIPAGTTYQPGTLALDGAALTDVADSDAGTGGAGGIAVDLVSLPGGSSRTVSFAVKIN